MSLFAQISLHADIDVLLVADELINVASLALHSCWLQSQFARPFDSWHIDLRVHHVIDRQCHISSLFSNRFTNLRMHHVFALG